MTKQEITEILGETPFDTHLFHTLVDVVFRLHSHIVCDMLRDDHKSEYLTGIALAYLQGCVDANEQSMREMNDLKNLI